MKVITEAILRDELRNSQPECYFIPEGKILSPAAREYLQQRKIKISKERPQERRPASIPPEPPAPGKAAAAQPKYSDYVTGAFYLEKPEHMTHLYGNVLVPKNHPRILFRGKLDSLQSLVVLDQALIADLGDILSLLREMMRCDVLNEAFANERIIGLSHAELRERSHDPMKFYRIKQMTLPDYTMGKHYALLNQLRTEVRECETAAADAFCEGGKYTRVDIIEELNRLSSALHIMMCKYLAGEYR